MTAIVNTVSWKTLQDGRYNLVDNDTLVDTRTKAALKLEPRINGGKTQQQWVEFLGGGRVGQKVRVRYTADDVWDGTVVSYDDKTGLYGVQYGERYGYADDYQVVPTNILEWTSTELTGGCSTSMPERYAPYRLSTVRVARRRPGTVVIEEARENGLSVAVNTESSTYEDDLFEAIDSLAKKKHRFSSHECYRYFLLSVQISRMENPVK